MPTFLGLLIQGNFYGISLIWPATAVGLTLMILTIQNKNLLLDPMTGLYNRKYLDTFKTGERKYSIMMLDLNGFKSINDSYGHSEGDIALNSTAELLLASVGAKGTAVRYAGDEFIILLNTDDEDEAKKCIDRLEKNFENYNSTSNKPYQLRYSLGWGIFGFSDDLKDEALKVIDARMYENKKEYYSVNDRRRH
ncbi:MAG: GGDEF domain-containing protein [Lachnospiraceae bacterium]|nr:GGDEF domain-containing protein [Lachnospiraceae bacterium]